MLQKNLILYQKNEMKMAKAHFFDEKKLIKYT